MLRTLFIILIASGSLSAANYYRFQTRTDTYSPLTGDTVVSPITVVSNNGFEYMLPLTGTTFNFFGNSYLVNDSTIYIYFSTNGHLGIQTDTSFIIFDALFTWLDSIDINSTVSYKVEGNGNERIVKLQWKNLSLRAGQASNYANVQLWLYQSSGLVEVRYGPSSTNNQSGYTIANGPNVGMFHSNKTFTQMYEKIWVNGSLTNYSLDSAKTVVFKAMSGVPTDGTVYQFIPAHLLSVSDIPSEGQFRVFPNPVADELTISFKSGTGRDAEVVVVDASGRQVLRSLVELGQTQHTVSTRDIPNGNYQVIIQDFRGRSSSSLTILHR